MPAPAVEAFTASHTLDEDAARLAEPGPGLRADPSVPAPVAWEPESPAPRTSPSSDFDLLGSLRQPIAPPEPRLDTPQRRMPVIARLLGHLGSGSEGSHDVAQKASTQPAPTADPLRMAGSPRSWPVPTRWLDRPIQRRDPETEGDLDPATLQAPVESKAIRTEPAAEVAAVPSPYPAPLDASPVAAPEPAPVPAAVLQAAPAPEPRSEPELAVDATPPEAEPVPEGQPSATQQSLFELPPASTDRWAVSKPDITIRTRPEWPASDPLDDSWAPPPATMKPSQVEAAPVAARRAQDPAPWPPIGASWPAVARPAAPWPMPGDDQVPASVLASAQDAETESPLVAALWAESAQQVLDRGTVRVCHHCALPVSTQARFCRRCGTQQA